MSAPAIIRAALELAVQVIVLAVIVRLCAARAEHADRVVAVVDRPDALFRS